MRCVLVAGFAGVMVVGVAGCGMGTQATAPVVKSALPTISGTLHGGQQPVSGARIQLYAANTTTAMGASTALISSTVLTDAGGNFSITGDYMCPSAGALVYMVATGGNPGLPGNVNNSGLAMMTALGTCGSLTNSTFVQVNELTTVVTVEALAPFMADYAHVGSDSANTLGLSGAFATVASLLDVAGGALRAQATGVTVPAATLYTLADVLAACVNTTGGSAGDGSACGTLFANATGTGTTADTVQAMLHMVQSPAQSVTALFGLVTANAPFGPGLATAPGDFTVAILYPLPHITTSLPQGYYEVIDISQHVWVYVSADSYNSTTQTYQYATGFTNIYDGQGGLAGSVAAGVGGVYLPAGGEADSFGNVWTINSDQTASKYGPNGNPISPAGGFPYPFQIPPNLVLSPGRPGQAISSVAVDTSGNLWGIASGAGQGCYNELSPAGLAITPSGDFCAQAGNNIVAEASADGAGNIWLLGTRIIGKVNSQGNLIASGINSNGCFVFYPQGDSRLLNDTLNMTYDRSHDQLWGFGFYHVGALKSDGTQEFCKPNGDGLPLIPGSTSGGVSQMLELIVGGVDGAGNFWFVTYGYRSTNTSISFIGGLNELNSTGSLITPFSASGGVYGLNASNAFQPAADGEGIQGLSVDSSGNLWIVNGANHSLEKILGLAVPKSYQ